MGTVYYRDSKVEGRGRPLSLYMVWKIRTSFSRKVVFEAGFHSWVVTLMYEPSNYQKQQGVRPGKWGLRNNQQPRAVGTQCGVY